MDKPTIADVLKKHLCIEELEFFGDKAGNLHRAMQEWSSLQNQSLIEAVEILKELCQLKHYKDTIGKDSLYEKSQPEAWKKANDFLNSITRK